MRKTVLALFLALTTCMAAISPAAGLDGFDLGDMPPLPPPLLDDADAQTPLSIPGSGAESPLVQGAPASSGPLLPPPSVAPAATAPDSGQTAGGYSPPSGSYGAPAAGFSDTPLPPPPPLAPPPVDDYSAPGSAAAATPATPALPAAASAVAPASGTSVPADDRDVTGLAEGETPRPGEITGGRVNVRAGPNTQYESIAVLTTGTPLTVIAKNGDWYKVVYPSDHLASIHKRFVTADVPGEIPEEGVPGVVNRNDADVHAFYWDKSTVVGKLNEGDPVVIRQERGQWYRILPPASARAYVFARYVKLDEDAPVVADTAPLPVNSSVDMAAVGAESAAAAAPAPQMDEERLREIKEARAREIQAEFDRQDALEEQRRRQEEFYRQQDEAHMAEMDRRQREAEQLVRARAQADLNARMLQANQLESALRDLDSRLYAIDGEKFRQADIMGQRFGQMVNPPTIVGSSAAWVPPDPPTGGYVGWVENIGRVGGAPSPFRLTRDGEIRFWLVSDMHDLNQFTNLRVILDGDIQHVGGTTANVLRVDRIRLLTEWEVAGGATPSVNRPSPQAPPGRPPFPGQPGMPGQSGFGAPVPGMAGAPQPPGQEQPYFDPYANAADVTDYSQPGFERPPAPQAAQPGFPGQPGIPGASAAAPFGDPFGNSQGAVYQQPQQPVYQQPPASYDVYGGYGGGYGSYGADPYRQRPPDDDNIGTADLVTSVENVFGAGYVPPGGYGTSYGQTTYGQTTTYDAGVYGGTTYGGAAYGGGTYDPGTAYVGGYDSGYGGGYGAPEFPNAQPATGEIRPSDSSQLPDVVGGIGSYSTSAGLISGEGVGLRVGEVETDVYEKPIINEIIP